MKKPAARTSSASGSVGSALGRSRVFVRTQYWIWPLVAAGILGFVAVVVRQQMEGAMKALLESPAHRRNLLNPEFDAVGVGIVLEEFAGQRTYYIAQEFAWLGSRGR